MTPLQIETLIKVYAQPCEKLNAFGLAQLKEGRLVQPDPRVHPDDGKTYHGYTLTTKGAAMMDALVRLPIPQFVGCWITEFKHRVDEVNL